MPSKRKSALETARAAFDKEALRVHLMQSEASVAAMISIAESLHQIVGVLGALVGAVQRIESLGAQTTDDHKQKADPGVAVKD